MGEFVGPEFEKPIVELESKIAELQGFAASENIDFSREISLLEQKCERLKKEIYGSLTPPQRVQLARHPRRPYLLDYLPLLVEGFTELHGDRAFADDSSIVGGLAFFNRKPVLVVGHQKGRTTQENMKRNFGMPHPEGYRKALRLMRLAERFGRPILSFIDTPGAYPGIGAEERGQSEAIARNLLEMASLKVPIVCVVTGEGGSGGALALGVADRIFMLEHAIYSVISPEGCASILWRDAAKAPEAATALKLASDDLLRLGVADAVIPEPLGGAHRDPGFCAEGIRKAVAGALSDLGKLSVKELVDARYEKYRRIGVLAGEVRAGRLPRSPAVRAGARKKSMKGGE